MRVLIPVDGSVSCRNALDLLAARARRMQVKPEVSLINVQHPVPMGIMTQVPGGFITLGLLLILVNALSNKSKKKGAAA